MTGRSPLTVIYGAARRVLQPVMRAVLKQRIRQGKDDPTRAGEKLGQPTVPRPDGPLVWVHAVGLGEVLALRPLIDALQVARPGLMVLVTSTARSSAQVIGRNLPPGALHQMLPLDGPDFMRRFLDYWQPALSVWSEQDLWPGAISDTAARGIPLAYVNARMNAVSFASRARLAGLYRDMLRRFDLVCAQDAESAAHLRLLGADAVAEMRSLKPAAPPLRVDESELETLRHELAGRRVWVAASTHAADEVVVIAAQQRLWAADPAWLLILTPRLPARADEIAAALDAAGLGFVQRSRGGAIGPDTGVLLADSFGELGLWYRLAESAFVGGSLGGAGGHNPWEAICLGVPVICGPDTANFRADYAELAALGLARQIPPGDAAAQRLADEVARSAGQGGSDDARALVQSARLEVDGLAQKLVQLMDVSR
ncbi:MAG: glycosyltransferase N-terminal domain-containing protein [Tabrizicola sp.]|uniref:3-deoxy-D-manno-octulosonic acid transferase n=1 Tax=Tabrizicola sp. TaxID=2005166 RepID=UPI002735A1F9|nr:glycosyltransferase N-terminal domain-containing protein [Tabrizicola sp.]MDP3264370.1 glycosyltransferase N-terminal domain-containing protein [Tabrizicola sp.]MDP3648820.1 glycosyltransferase N-terminal domain-containing protein [Paracoccaceae bacterium]MDZ4067229.1 glycosyltransferase N-terminal domain-containing protein [Tabrizicola sp.]